MTRKPSVLRQRQHAATAEAMLDAAERALVKRGYDHATMQQIAAETGCATGTFYLYFRNKQVLFEALLLRHLKAQFQAAREEMDKVAGPLEKVRQSLSAVLRYWQQHRPFTQLALAVWPMRQRAIQDRLGQIGWQGYAQFRRETEGLLRQGQKQGLVRRDVPPGTLLYFIDTVSFSFFEWFCLESSKQTLREKMRVLWGLIAGGIVHREKP